MPVDVVVPLSFGQRLSWFCAAHWRGMTFVLTPLLVAIIFIFADNPVPKHFICGYTLLVMATLWVTEVVPLAATSVIPIFVFPVAGIMSTADTCFAYVTDTVIMIIASLLLAYSFEESGLHRRMALGIVQIVGYTHTRLIFGLSFLTMFISIWVANMAATTMMLPINTAVLEILEKQGLGKMFDYIDGEKNPTLTSQCYYLVSAYSSSVGGIGSLVGTGTNLAFKGLFETAYPAAPELLGFAIYSAFTIPLMLALNVACYFYMCTYFMGMFRPGSKRSKEVKLSPEGQAATKASVKEQWRSLGSITYYELAAGILFMSAMALFVTRSPSVFRGWADEISDQFVPPMHKEKSKFIKNSTAAVFITILMFLLPSSLIILNYFRPKTRKELPSGPISAILVWESCEKRIPWEFLLLVGGGFALSTGSKASGLSAKIGEFLKVLEPLPHSLVLVMVLSCAVTFTNFCANVAIANLLCPVSMELAKSVGINPLLLCTAAGLGSSFCYCLPIGTPCNAIVQATSHIKSSDMAKCGIGMSVITILIAWLFMSTYMKLFWETDVVPPWAHSE